MIQKVQMDVWKATDWFEDSDLFKKYKGLYRVDFLDPKVVDNDS